MSETQNLILAVILSALVLGGWYYFVDLPHLKQVEIQQAALQKAKVKPAAVQEVHFPSRAEALAVAPRVPIESEFLEGSISLRGARLDDLALVQFKETASAGSPPVKLLSPSGSEDVYFAEFGWLPSGQAHVPGPQTVWQSSGGKLTPKTPVTLTWQNPEGAVFRIKISLDEHYMFTIEQQVLNHSGKALEISPYALLNRFHSLKEKEFYISHVGPVGVLGGTLKEVSYKDLMKNNKVGFEQTSGWLGMGDKYWLTALIPASKEARFDAQFSYAPVDGQPRYQADYVAAAEPIAPGAEGKYTTRLFAGAKKVGLLDSYMRTLDIPFFDRAVDFGWLYFLTKPFFKALQFFYRLFGNFGLAILTLTIVIKSLMFPLANKSYRSMNQMKELNPEIVRLREQYKGDKVRLNQEIMDFYKRKKINPMAGCLPILIQIPIFFALYKVLFITIEMRQAPFYGWIHDLSVPDPTSIFNLFGLLPFDVPPNLHIGVWPILMGTTMLIQQLINPPPGDPMQAKIMRFLPFMFVMLFSSFPAGLVIYWTWSNTLSILQQRLLAGGLKKHKAKIAADS
jgi:YidC/Oxa1 family membrane protein insertase